VGGSRCPDAAALFVTVAGANVTPCGEVFVGKRALPGHHPRKDEAEIQGPIRSPIKKAPSEGQPECRCDPTLA
jgi:hypothetical protein